MNFIDSARQAVQTLAEEATQRGKELLGESTAHSEPAGPVTVTVAAGQDAVKAVWRDSARLSQVFGDVASVGEIADSRATFTVTTPQGDVTLTTTVIDDADGIRFVDSSSSSGGTEIVVVRLTDAPNDLGTEVTLRLRLPAPDFAAKTAAFKILYRLRALVQTGEIPTLTPTPAARPGDR
ncbi:MULTISPECIES: hypothetical protein [Actinomycetes]|uniref:hypothetical protein n=1 Tax=Actinomycetes TaxID=1760 RepID=UPI00068AACDB|nr:MULTISPECIES: hypothetical protein [Actinomycetes]